MFQASGITFCLLLLTGSSWSLSLKELCPAYPICDNALLAAYADLERPESTQAVALQPSPAEDPCPNYPFCDVNHVALAQGVPCPNYPNCDVHHVAAAQRSILKKRSLPVPGTTSLVPGSAAEAQWYQQQLAQIALQNGRKKRSPPANLPPRVNGFVPGSKEEATWIQD